MSEKKVLKTFEENSLIGKMSQGEYPTKKEMTRYGEFTLRFPSGRDYQIISQRKAEMFGGVNINSFDLSYAFSVDRDMTLSVCITEYPVNYPDAWKGRDIVDFADKEVKNALYKAFNSFCTDTNKKLSGDSK